MTKFIEVKKQGGANPTLINVDRITKIYCNSIYIGVGDREEVFIVDSTYDELYSMINPPQEKLAKIKS